jgi:hypothetical protein
MPNSIFESSESFLIPKRNSSFKSGSEFISLHMNDSVLDREQCILEEFLDGNLPDFLRQFKKITITEKSDTITYLVMSDVLSIGSDSDYIRMPMNPLTAKKIANKYDCTLPTKKMCDQIWKAAEIKLNPQPKGPPYDSSMLSSQAFKDINDRINKQMAGKDITKLITGIKKDVIIDFNLLTSGKGNVSIYGWFYTTGMAIQGPAPNCHSHNDHFLDYSHGIRLIAQDVIVNGRVKRFFDVLNDKNLCHLISEQPAYDASNIYR